MNKRYLKFILLFVCSINLYADKSSLNDSNLSIKLSVVPEKVLLLKPCSAEIVISNRGTYEPVIGRNIFDFIQIMDENGHNLEQTGFLTYIDGEPLEQGESKVFSEKLDLRFAQRTNLYSYSCIPPGKYKIQVLFEDKYLGLVKSNIVDLEVVMPEGRDLLAIQAMNTAVSGRTSKETVSKLEKVSEDYADTNYADSALKLAAGHARYIGVDGLAKAIELRKKIVKLYPKSSLVMVELGRISDYYLKIKKDPQSLHAFLIQVDTGQLSVEAKEFHQKLIGKVSDVEISKRSH